MIVSRIDRFSTCGMLGITEPPGLLLHAPGWARETGHLAAVRRGYLEARIIRAGKGALDCRGRHGSR